MGSSTGKLQNEKTSADKPYKHRSIPGRTNLLSYGYCRFEQNCLLMIIPKEICEIIALFYGKYDFNGDAFIYESDYDRNGICYLLGTDAGNHKWINPAESGSIKLKTSGWHLKEGCINDFVGRTPCISYSSSIENGYVFIDFGTKVIKPSAYTLRHSDFWDGFYLRNWDFLGSIDVCKWMIIKQHKDDQTFNKPGQSHTFKINKCNQYFSRFKIQISLKNSTGDYTIMTT